MTLASRRVRQAFGMVKKLATFHSFTLTTKLNTGSERIEEWNVFL